MDTQFHGLPPLKRFRIQQRLEDEEARERELKLGRAGNSVDSLSLPAKKRKESRVSSMADYATAARTSTYFLPTKKRIWAIHPDLVHEHGYMPFDLNLEYKPQMEEEPATMPAKGFVEKEEEKKTIFTDNETREIDQILEYKESEQEAEEEEEDDGILCAVCQSTDGDPSDPIVFCDGCDLMVHASCYGNPLLKQIPEGDWFCAQCSSSSSSQKASENGFSCCLCPVKGGAMKPMKNGSWAHIVCVLYVPEAFFGDPEGREEIDCSVIPEKRWKQKCYICKNGNGCAIDCSEPKCCLSFHVTCGLNEDLWIEYREGKRKRKRKGSVVAGFCKEHSELWKKQQQTGKFKIVARDE